MGSSASASLPTEAEAAVSRVTAREPVTEALAEAFARGGEAWPGVTCDAAAFAQAVRQRLPEASLPVAEEVLAIQALHTTDLYFAVACAERDLVALAAFEDRFVPGLRAVLAKLGFAETIVDEVLQVARITLFVRGEHGPPRILEYGGRGPLRGWLRVVVSRLAFKASAKPARVEDAWIAEGEGYDLELDFLRKTYGETFKHAFAEAMASLPVKDRLLLKQRFALQTTVVALGAQHRVNASTITRWVQDARERVLEATRRGMMARLRVGALEVESILRLLQRDLDLSLITYREPADRGVSG